ncbi:coiled-coil domain-containing protein 84-like [Elysia marginata]|uniref:Coiled-coil domain-containing protein 84-like n=1 Tax=Elysia marginata TaxID=1093978 RepID=A0AAV4J2X6_9GAST|nr:coiled-coil domain-containing protein 84-like [Elysia marginata]
MSQPKTQKVFIQFRYCSLCRSNHKKGKKHVLTERHQQIVTNVLKKFSKKIAEAKKSLEEPTVKDVLWPDVNHKFWCYFCLSDFECHKVNYAELGDCVVPKGGILEHIVREDHVTNTTTFLKDNRVNMKRTPEFVLTSQEYIKFLGNVEKAISVFFQDRAHLLQQISSDIRAQTAIQHQIVAAGLLDQEDDSLGNIYTNAVPPWMMPDADATNDNLEIGPTMKDLEKHRKLEKKAKLPATRVGAKFDRKADQSESWMPSFGGVWHHSRRTDSLKQFNRRQMGKHKLNLEKSTPLPSHQELKNSALEPFVYPATVELTHHKEGSTNKIPRTTSTDPSPWNSYISSPCTTADRSRPPMALPNSMALTVLADQSCISSNQSYFTQSVGTSEHLHITESQSSELSVKPYVSKRRRQNSSAYCDEVSNVGHRSGEFSLHTAQHHHPLHPCLTDNQPFITGHYANQNTNLQALSCAANWTNQHLNNGFTNKESSSQCKWPSLTPTRTSTMQPVRLISTPLLQDKKDNR